jgi:hypothetical protein
MPGAAEPPSRMVQQLPMRGPRINRVSSSSKTLPLALLQAKQQNWMLSSE